MIRRFQFAVAILMMVPWVFAQQQSALKVNLGDVSLNKAPLIIAAEEGLFHKYGLEVDLRISRRAADTVRDSGFAVNPEKVGEHPAPDLSVGGGTPMMVGRTTNIRRLQQIIIATTDPILRGFVFVKPDITRPEQLKGKRLGASGYGSVTGFMARLFAQRQGWDPDQDVSIFAGALGLKYLEEGLIDALFALEMHSAAALFAGFKPLVEARQWNVPVAGSGVVTTRRWLDSPQNREKALSFLKALVEAISLLKKDQKYAIMAFQKWYGIRDLEQIGWIWKNGKDEMQAKPYPAVEGIRKTMEIYNYHEMRQHTAEDFYDASLVKELDESGFIDQFYR